MSGPVEPPLHRGRRGVPPWSGRAVVLGDQVVSSLSNVLAVVLVARALGASDFGRFAVAYAVLTAVLGLCRSSWGTRITMTADPADARRLTLALAGATVVLAPPVAGLVLLGSLLCGGSGSWPALLIVACATPVVCLQDLLRFGATASGRPGVALASDGVWLAVVLLPFPFGARLPATAGLALWFVAAGFALAVALAGFGGRPRIAAGLREIRRRHPVGDAVAAGAVAINLGVLALVFVTTRAIGPDAAGALRGAATSFGPVNVLVAFVGLGLTTALVRRDRRGDRIFCARTALLLVLPATAWAAVLLAAPDPWGRAAFGASWTGIRSVLPWTSAEYLALCATTAAVLGLKARGRARELLRLRIGGAVLATAGGAAGALSGDVRLVSAGVAAAGAAVALCGWGLLLRPPVAAPAARAGRGAVEGGPRTGDVKVARAAG